MSGDVLSDDELNVYKLVLNHKVKMVTKKSNKKKVNTIRDSLTKSKDWVIKFAGISCGLSRLSVSSALTPNEFSIIHKEILHSNAVNERLPRTGGLHHISSSYSTVITEGFIIIIKIKYFPHIAVNISNNLF